MQKYFNKLGNDKTLNTFDIPILVKLFNQLTKMKKHFPKTEGIAPPYNHAGLQYEHFLTDA